MDVKCLSSHCVPFLLSCNLSQIIKLVECVYKNCSQNETNYLRCTIIFRSSTRIYTCIAFHSLMRSHITNLQHRYSHQRQRRLLRRNKSVSVNVQSVCVKMKKRE